MKPRKVPMGGIPLVPIHRMISAKAAFCSIASCNAHGQNTGIMVLNGPIPLKDGSKTGASPYLQAVAAGCPILIWTS